MKKLVDVLALERELENRLDVLNADSVFLQSDKGSIVFSEMIRSLSYNCINSETEIKNRFIKNEVFDKNRLILSNLRSAPIIGLAAKLSC